MAKALTAAAILRFRAGPMRRFIRDGGARSLYLVIQTTGSRSWVMRFRRPDGQITKLTLGPVDLSGQEHKGEPVTGAPLTLAAARALAASIHRSRAQGHDVAAGHKAKRSPAQGDTFGQAVHDFIENYAKPKMRSWRTTQRLLDGLAQRWSEKPLQEIDAAAIWTLVEETRRIGTPGRQSRIEKPSNSRARLLFAALSSMFGWLQRQRRIEVNPCRSVQRPANGPARERVLTNDEIKLFWSACGEVGEPFGQLLKLLLLTGARLREVSGMRRSELHADGMWHLPGTRTKNKKPHVVALPPLALEILGTVLPIDSDLIFTTTGKVPVNGFGKVKQRLDRAMDIPPWCLHDLRRSFVTGLAELSVPPHVIELAVNHVSGTRGGIAGTYNRSQMMTERKAALARWADHVAGLVAGRPDNVVPLAGRK